MKKASIVITGCTKGFGLLFTEKLASEGHKVYATFRNPLQADRLKQVAEANPNIELVELNVNNSDQIEQLVALIEKKDGKLGVLINNAGYGLMGLLSELTTDKLSEQFATNVFAPAELSRQLMPLLNKNEEGGLIINISSVASFLGLPAFGAYSASKAALNNLSMSLACENASSKLSVVVVEPGPFKTDFRESVIKIGDVEKYQNARSKFFSNSEEPEAVINLINSLVKQKMAGKLASFKEIPIGKGSHLFRLLSRWVPQQWIVKALAEQITKASA